MEETLGIRPPPTGQPDMPGCSAQLLYQGARRQHLPPQSRSKILLATRRPPPNPCRTSADTAIRVPEPRRALRRQRAPRTRRTGGARRIPHRQRKDKPKDAAIYFTAAPRGGMFFNRSSPRFAMSRLSGSGSVGDGARAPPHLRCLRSWPPAAGRPSAPQPTTAPGTAPGRRYGIRSTTPGRRR